jgi:hypothetical protein
MDYEDYDGETEDLDEKDVVEEASGAIGLKGQPVKPRQQRKIQQVGRQQQIYAALQNTGDPLKLKEIIGAKTVAEVYRTLDKLTIRREFHDALTKAGITFEFLIEGIKREAIGGDKSADRLKAFEMLLKTLGLDKYDDVQSGAASSWEERLLKAIEGHEEVLNENVQKDLRLSSPMPLPSPEDYRVITPEIPASALAKKKSNETLEQSLMSHDFPRPK